MGKTREIKKRIKAVGNIRRITKTMQMIATSKFARAQQLAVAGKPYSEALFELVGQLASGLGDTTHPLLQPGKPGGKELSLVITSDRGLCGPYNGSVLRAFMAMLKANPSARQGSIDAIGKKGVGFLKFANVNVARIHSQFGDKPTYDKVRALAEEYTQRFLSGEISSVRIVSMKYISAGRQTPAVMQLLPFQTPRSARRRPKPRRPRPSRSTSSRLLRASS